MSKNLSWFLLSPIKGNKSFSLTHRAGLYFSLTHRAGLYPRAAMTKSHEPGDLKQQAFILSQFWKLEVWKEGVAWVASSWRLLRVTGPGLSPSFWWQQEILLFLALQMQYSSICLHLHMALCLFIWPSSYKDTGHIEVGAHSRLTQLQSAMTLFPNKVTFWGMRG